MAILNSRDLRLAVARIAQLERAIGRSGTIGKLKEGLPLELSDTRIATLRSELKRLHSEVAAFESLQMPGKIAEALEENELGMLPILARLARKMSQRELAEKLNIKEQQIQRYEQQRYSSISLERYQNILQILGVDLHPRLASEITDEKPREQLDVELTPALMRDLRQRNWVDLPNSLSVSEMKARLLEYVEQGRTVSGKRTLHRRSKSASDKPLGLIELWKARVISVAGDRRRFMRGKFNIADTRWLGSLIQLSAFPDGPVRAVEMLREKGIILIVESHLPGTLLDGAAFLIEGNIPVIGMTLRHDRIDNFWFTLLHELGHIYLHFNSGLEDGFVDDLDDHNVSRVESEADDFARSRLIPDEAWNNSVARYTQTSTTVEKFAFSLKIHPAIVAGRIRSERDYKLFPKLVGNGQIRNLFNDSRKGS